LRFREPLIKKEFWVLVKVTLFNFQGPVRLFRAGFFATLSGFVFAVSLERFDIITHGNRFVNTFFQKNLRFFQNV